jgi:hypothetical protein
MGGVDCDGDFGDGRVVYSAPAGKSISSPTLTPDELELFFFEYVEEATGVTAGGFFRATRASKSVAFGESETLAELDAACASTDRRSIELSRSGLRAYVVCYADTASGSNGALQLATRDALGAPFELEDAEYGSVGAGAALSNDELELVSTASTNAAGAAPPEIYERGALSEPFGPGGVIPGLEASGLITPDLAPDDVSLFGAEANSIVVATRPRRGADFAAAMAVIPAGADRRYGAPEVSADCRALYYVVVDTVPTATPPSQWSFQVSER